MKINPLINNNIEKVQTPLPESSTSGLANFNKDRLEVQEKAGKEKTETPTKNNKPDQLELTKNIIQKQSVVKTTEAMTPTKAQETVDFVKGKIIEQSSNAILTQANLSPQIILTIMQQ